MNILRYTKAQVQHRNKMQKKTKHKQVTTQAGKFTYKYQANKKENPTVCTIVLKMDHCENVFCTANDKK